MKLTSTNYFLLFFLSVFIFMGAAHSAYALTGVDGGGGTGGSGGGDGGYVGGSGSPQVFMSASPSTVSAGQTSALSWTASSATSCSLDHNIGTVAVSGSKNVNPTTSTTYTITCTNSSGSSSYSTTITVSSAGTQQTADKCQTPASSFWGVDPTVAGEASYYCQAAGYTTHLCAGSVCGGVWGYDSAGENWNTEDANGVNRSLGQCAEFKNASPYILLGVYTYPGCPTTPPTTYPPTDSISVTQPTITAGDSTQLNWNSANVASCSIDQGIGNVTPNQAGYQTISPSSTTTYTITCANSSGTTVTAQTKVTVNPATTPLAVSCVVQSTADTNTNVPWYSFVSDSSGSDTGYTWQYSGYHFVRIESASSGCTDQGNTCPTGAESGASCSAVDAGKTCWTGDWSCSTTSGYQTSYSCEPTPPSGATTYTYAWTGDDGLTGTASTTSKTYTTTGVKQGTVTVTTADGSGSGSATCQTTVSGPQPDLTAGTVGPSSATAGTQVSLTSTITNGGNATTGAGFWNLFQRATDSSGSNATDLGTYQRTTALANGSSFGASLLYTFPSSGTWYLRACADKSSAGDATGTIVESNENNNCSPGWTVIHVCASGQTWNGTACTTTPTCPSGQTWNGSACVPDTSCPSGQTWNGTSCVPNPPGCGLSHPTISATPPRVRSGGTVTVSWSATGGVDTSCVVTKNGVTFATPPVNSCSIPTNPGTPDTITTQTVYKISCDNGENTAQVLVNLIPQFQEF